MVARVASLFMSPIRMNNNVVIDMAINALTGTLLGPLCKGKTKKYFFKSCSTYVTRILQEFEKLDGFEIFKNFAAISASLTKFRMANLKHTKERSICVLYFIYYLHSMFQILQSEFCLRSRRQQNSSRILIRIPLIKAVVQNE